MLALRPTEGYEGKPDPNRLPPSVVTRTPGLDGATVMPPGEETWELQMRPARCRGVSSCRVLSARSFFDHAVSERARMFQAFAPLDFDKSNAAICVTSRNSNPLADLAT